MHAPVIGRLGGISGGAGMLGGRSEGTNTVMGATVIAGAAVTDTDAGASTAVADSGVASEEESDEAAAEAVELLGEVMVTIIRTDAETTSIDTRAGSTPADEAMAEAMATLSSAVMSLTSPAHMSSTLAE